MQEPAREEEEKTKHTRVQPTRRRGGGGGGGRFRVNVSELYNHNDDSEEKDGNVEEARSKRAQARPEVDTKSLLAAIDNVDA